jgi:hypothetical protein
MASLVPSLIISAIPRLGLEPGLEGGLEKWLNIATLIPIASESEAAYRFSIPEPQDLVPYLSYDFERFSLAAAESFLRGTQQPTGNLNYAGWRLLELYYAAFFAGHAITRSQGAGVALVNGSTAKRLADIASLYDVEAEPLQKGSWFYRILLNEEDDAIIEFRSVTNGSGVHDTFWREFCTFLKASAAGAVEAQLPDASEFLVGVTEISDRIRYGGDGSGAWLAKIRNDINYRHGYSAWYPEPKRRVATSSVDSIRLLPSANVRLDACRTNDPLAAFAGTCGFLASLSFELSSYIAERSTRGGAFGQKWRRFTALTQLRLQA